MKPALLVDIGSTYTKAVVVDLGDASILGRAASLTTVDSDVRVGIARAVQKATGKPFRPADHALIRVSSSAAGGLRIVAIGLAATMTANAARQAALGAGGKVIGVYAGSLNGRQIEEIERTKPDVIVLAGGTDNGDTETILHNSRMLAASRLVCPMVVAGNRHTRAGIVRTLAHKLSRLRVVDNVLPEPNRLNIAPAREAIRELFADHIVEAKGLHGVRQMVDGRVIPTPSSVLNAAQLLADGTNEQRGIGDLLLVDVGGATTDVHSIAVGEPAPGRRFNVAVDLAGEPRVKRTVEGDLGMRVSAQTLLETAGAHFVSRRAGLNGDVESLREAVLRLSKEVDRLPVDAFGRSVDLGLGRTAVAIAVERHVGHLVREAGSAVAVQVGKDLSEVSDVIGTGGVFAYSPDAPQMLAESVATSRDTVALKPNRPQLWLDRLYLLWASGLIVDLDPNAALNLARQSLKQV